MEAETKWPSFTDNIFKRISIYGNCCTFSCTELFSNGVVYSKPAFGSDNGAPNQQNVMQKTNDDLV